MRKKFLLLLVSLCLVMFPTYVFGGEEKVEQQKVEQKSSSESKISVDSEIFSGYKYSLSTVDKTTGKKISGEHPNTFHLGRVYLNFKGKIDEKFSAKITVDAAPVKDVNTNYFLFVKYAFLQYNISKNLYLKGGLIDNPFHSFIIGVIWKHLFVENNYGAVLKYWNSAESGAYIRYENKEMGVDAAFGINNGSGFKQNPDSDERKDVWGYGRVFLAKTFHLGGYASYTINEDDIILKTSLLAAFDVKYALFGYNLLFEKNGDLKRMGHSIYARAKFDNYGFHVKGGYWEQDTSLDDNSKDILVGGSFSPSEKISFALSGKISWNNQDDKNMIVMLDSVFSF